MKPERSDQSPAQILSGRRDETRRIDSIHALIFIVTMKQSTKPISSPSRTDLFPPPLMSFIRADSGNRSKSGRSRSSPIFVRKKNVAIETQEPSSPKVTCMGQVRANKRSSKTPAASAARCRWIRSVLSFNRRYCRTFWNRSAMLFRRKREIRRKSSISESRVGNGTEDSEKDEVNDGVRDAVFASSVLSPPKNALILTRCRSAPHRSSFYGNRYRSPPMRSDGTGDGEEEEQKTERGNGNRAANKIESRNSGRLFKNLENSIGDGDSNSVNSRESKIEEKSTLNRNQILTRCKSEPARIAEKVYGEMNLREEERSVMATNNSCLSNNFDD